MCQLLGMNCAKPTDFSFSLRGFCKRGGCTDVHVHGWGLSVYEEQAGGVGLRSFHDTLPASKSPLADLIQQYPMRTHNMMAHIRYATQGEVTLENVHPFVRVWKGIQMCFAHNGECPRYGGNGNRIVLVGKAKEYNTPTNVPYHPVGDTDSEAVFCAILNAMSAEFTDGLPTLPVLHEFLQQICDEIVQNHNEYMATVATTQNIPIEQQMPLILNFLLGCGPYTLFAFSMPGRRPGSKVWNGLHYIIRQPPFTTATLVDDDYEIDFAQVTTPTDRVTVVTTKPLTTEHGWTEFIPGQLILFDNGLPYETPDSCTQVEQAGRGLVSKTMSVRYTQRKLDATTTTSSIQLQQQIDHDNNNHQHDTNTECRDDDERHNPLIQKQQQQQQQHNDDNSSTPTPVVPGQMIGSDSLNTKTASSVAELSPSTSTADLATLLVDVTIDGLA